jgi:hypothetical protein
MKKLAGIAERHGWLLPLVMVLLFVSIAVIGVSWGLPGIWNPDELIRRVIAALNGEWEFDTLNFDYPSLPKYAMFFLGKILLGLGLANVDVILGARILSVTLGAGIVFVVGLTTRLSGAGLSSALLASFFLISSSEFVTNSRFAHNDIYLAFFPTLLAFALAKYLLSNRREWLYFAFFCAGLATSSKYNGGALVLAPAIVFVWREARRRAAKISLPVVEVLFIGGALSVLGYGVGTPKAILWFAFYLKRALPAIMNQATFGRRPDELIGFLGQWETISQTLGLPVFILTGLVLIIAVVGLARIGRITFESDKQREILLVLLLLIFLLDLPIMLSYNYKPRFFVPILPLVAVVFAVTFENVVAFLARLDKRYVTVAIVSLVLVFTYAALRVVSVTLMFVNDARIPAGEFITTLESGTAIEFTTYHPNYQREQFARAFNYPLIFLQRPDQQLPTSPFYEYNSGEEGIEERQPDYLVFDSFIYERFEDEHICETNPADCKFIRGLLRGDTDYRLIASFSYELPAWLPRIAQGFLNPDIRIYERAD